jgi:hypothetical protein
LTAVCRTPPRADFFAAFLFKRKIRESNALRAAFARLTQVSQILTELKKD